MTRETFALEIQLLDRQGNPFGRICEVHALMANDRGDSTGRCSGTFIMDCQGITPTPVLMASAFAGTWRGLHATVFQRLRTRHEDGAIGSILDSYTPEVVRAFVYVGVVFEMQCFSSRTKSSRGLDLGRQGSFAMTIRRSLNQVEPAGYEVYQTVVDFYQNYTFCKTFCRHNSFIIQFRVLNMASNTLRLQTSQC